MPDEKRSSKKESKRDKEKQDKKSSKKSKSEKSDTILASLFDEVKKTDKPVNIDKLLDRKDDKKDKSKKKHSKKEKSKKRKRERSNSSSRSRSSSRKDKKRHKKERKNKDRDSDVELSPWRKNLIEETLGVKIGEDPVEQVSDEDDLPVGSDFSTIKPSTSKQTAEESHKKEEKDDDLVLKEEAFPLSKEKSKNRSPSPDDVFEKLSNDKIAGPKTDILKKVIEQDKDKAMVPRNIKIQLKTNILPKTESEIEEKPEVKQEVKELDNKKNLEDGELSDTKPWATLNSDEENSLKENQEKMKQNGKTLSKEKKQKSDDDMSISTYDSDEDKARKEWTTAKNDKKKDKKQVDKSSKKDKLDKNKSKSSKSSKRKRSRSRSRSRGTYSRSRSRTYSSRSRSRSRSRSKSRSRRRSYSKSRSRSYSRSRSRSRSRRRSYSRSRSRSRSYDRRRRYDRGHGSYRSRYYDSRRRPYARKPIPPPRGNKYRQLEKLDKEKLLEIATKNATRMAIEGKLPGGMELIATIKDKSVDQLVTICKQLQVDKGDDERREAITSDEDERYEKHRHHRKRSRSASDGDFRSKPVKSTKIEINISNSNPLPTRSHQQLMDEGVLRLSFPVSSGAEHRNKVLTSSQNDWMPVSKHREEDLQLIKLLETSKVNVPTAYKGPMKPKEQPAIIGPALLPPGMKGDEPSLPPPPAPPVLASFDKPGIISSDLLPPPPLPPPSLTASLISAPNINSSDVTPESLLHVIRSSSGLTDGLEKDVPLTFRLPAPPPPPSLKPEDLVFGIPKTLKKPPSNLTELVAQRAKYNDRLQKNPTDEKARKKIAEIDNEMSAWAESKNLPGHFAGSTGVRVLKPDELEPLHPKYNAWAKKEDSTNSPSSCSSPESASLSP